MHFPLSACSCLYSEQIDLTVAKRLEPVSCRMYREGLPSAEEVGWEFCTIPVGSLLGYDRLERNPNTSYLMSVANTPY